MSTVFDTPPPNFPTHEVKDILLTEFSITGIPELLFSDRDQNFLITDSNKQKYILKISNSAEKLDDLVIQHKATLFIKSTDEDLKVPHQINKIKSINKDGSIYFIRLLEFIEGNFLKNINLDDLSYYKLGEFLGRLNLSLQNFDHKYKKTDFHWDVRAVNSIRSRLSSIDNQDDKNTISYFLEAYELNVQANDLKLSKMFIHNDGNDQNILIDNKGNVIGIIDFGDMVYSYRIAEPAICMAYVGLNNIDSHQPMFNVLKGYHSKFPLKNIELRSAIYIACLRLCISVTMSAWRTKLFPSNKYLSVSNNLAWNYLNKIKNEDLTILSNEMTNYVKS